MGVPRIAEAILGPILGYGQQNQQNDAAVAKNTADQQAAEAYIQQILESGSAPYSGQSQYGQTVQTLIDQYVNGITAGNPGTQSQLTFDVGSLKGKTADQQNDIQMGWLKEAGGQIATIDEQGRAFDKDGNPVMGELKGNTGPTQDKTALTSYLGRMNTLVGGYKDRYTSLMRNLDEMGAQEKADIGQEFGGVASRAGQDLTSAGLSASTVAPTVQAGIQREKSGAEGRLNESLRNQRLQWGSQLSGDLLNAEAQTSGDYLNSVLGLKTGAAGQQQNWSDAWAQEYLKAVTGYPAQGPGPANVGETIGTIYGNNLSEQQIQAAKKPQSGPIIGAAINAVGTVTGSGIGAYGAYLAGQ